MHLLPSVLLEVSNNAIVKYMYMHREPSFTFHLATDSAVITINLVQQSIYCNRIKSVCNTQAATTVRLLSTYRILVKLLISCQKIYLCLYTVSYCLTFSTRTETI